MPQVPENRLRDLLAEQLNLLEEDLALLDTEKFVPSRIGTRSFIDILAKDRRGRWVLIELKRSNAAAREAIHEIYKYVESVKAHLGARDDEIRAIIVSTEWSELLVPFSRFVHETSISVLGFKLIVDEVAASLTSCEQVMPLTLTSGRVLSPWHEISLYTSRERLASGLKSYDESCRAKGINDYIMLEMEAPSGFYEASVHAVASSLHVMRGGTGEPPSDAIADTASKLGRFEYMIYFVPQLLSKEDCLRIIGTDQELLKEVEEWVDDLDGDELLNSLQDRALFATPKVDRDYFDIGYPAKFQSKLQDEEGWAIVKVHRRGAFARNTVLSDNAILGEIAGEAGTSGQRLKRTILLSDKGEFTQLLNDLDKCLSNNSVWQQMIRYQLSEARADFPDCYLDASIFVPTTGMLTLFFATRDNGILYVPSYILLVKENEELRRMYVGELLPEDNRAKGPETFQDVIAKFYGGDLGALVMTMIGGGYEPRDIEILEDLGLLYSSFRCDANRSDRVFFRYKNGSWRTCEAIQPLQALRAYFELNNRLLRIINKKLSPRIGSGLCDGSSANKHLEQFVDENTMGRRECYINPPDSCDICSVPMSKEVFMSDGKLRDSTGWAFMCADCTVYYGAGIGWGIGQLYRKEGVGQWVLVGGSNNDFADEDQLE